VQNVATKRNNYLRQGFVRDRRGCPREQTGIYKTYEKENCRECMVVASLVPFNHF